ncbi:CD302 antigen [Ascaphus truei]|uniref:CD302 antigen n=1 Tax=Ascaphus truei TaxID=8439 RepID=UPI003F5AD09F
MKAALLLLLCGAADIVAGQGGLQLQVDECPSPVWIPFNNRCYTFLHAQLKNSLNIDLARDLCKVSGADIISINTEEENAFLLKIFQTEWKGPKEILLGLFYDSDDDSLKWYDNSEVTFTNWREETPSNEDLNTCAAMDTLTGQWEQISCEKFIEMGTVCKTNSRKRKQAGQRVLIIALITAIALLVIIVSVGLLLLYKRKVFSGFTSRNHHVGAQVLPYSDETILVEALEKEFSA